MNTKESWEHIWSYISQNHILVLSATYGQDIWSASLFYTPAATEATLLIMTATTSMHSKMLLKNHQASGAIYTNTREIDQIKGIQFKCQVTPLTEKEQASNSLIYTNAFPISKQQQETLWKIELTEIKMTDNTEEFGRKYYWSKSQ